MYTIFMNISVIVQTLSELQGILVGITCKANTYAFSVSRIKQYESHLAAKALIPLLMPFRNKNLLNLMGIDITSVSCEQFIE